jgi:hypothetical protein
LVLAGLLLAGGAAIWLFWLPPELRIEVVGVSGMRFVGSVKTELRDAKFEGGSGNAMSVRARTASYTIRSTGKAGPMMVRVLIDGQVTDTITADKDHPIVRGTVESGRVSQRAEEKQGPELASP